MTTGERCICCCCGPLRSLLVGVSSVAAKTHCMLCAGRHYISDDDSEDTVDEFMDSDSDEAADAAFAAAAEALNPIDGWAMGGWAAADKDSGQ